MQRAWKKAKGWFGKKGKRGKAKKEVKEKRESDSKERLKGKPGEVKSNGKRETKIGSDGRAEKERHHSDHGNPKIHTNPHDHEIRWDDEGNPHFSKPINHHGEVPPL